MKRLLYLLTLCIAGFNTISASPVDEQRAMRIGEAFLSSRGCKSLQLKNIDSKGIFPHLFVFSSPNSFVIVSADDAALPILGYSTNNSITLSRMPAHVELWLQSYDKQIAYAQANSITADEMTSSEWDNIERGRIKSAKGGVEPLLETAWGQGAPYNDMCPYDEQHNDNAVTGCAATAMAQIMRYYEYPAHGKGSNSYNSERYGTISADFASATYDWYNMKRQIKANGIKAQRDAVALLMYHCGVSVNMDYNVSAEGGSGSRTDYAMMALVNNFGYRDYNNRPITVENNFMSRDDVNNERWHATLQRELNNGRPMFYVGYGNESGHAWVCDGYDENSKYHMNWGWSGYGNGFYVMNALNPGSEGIGSGGSSQFNEMNHIIFGLIPADDLRVPASHIPVSVDGDSITIHVFPSSSSSRWNATTEASWLHLTASSGEGEGGRYNLSFYVDTNTTNEERSATIIVKQGGQQIPVTVYQYSCGAVSSLPYIEGFEGMTTSCWHTITVDGSSDSSFGLTDNSNGIAEGEQALQFVYSKGEPTRRQYLISPELNFGQAVQMTFRYRRQWSYNERFLVLYSTTDDDPSSFIYYVGNGYMDNADWHTFSALIPAEARHVAVVYENPGFEGRTWTIDDINFNTTETPEALISTFPYSQSFDADNDGWKAMSRNTENMELNNITVYNQAHSPRSVFRFTAKYSAADKWQYLISPRLALGNNATFSFYYRHSSSGTERFVVLYSTTGSTPECFIPIGDTIETATTEWTQHSVALPTEARYVAILYCPSNGKFLYIDDIEIDAESTEPSAIDDISISLMDISVRQRTISVTTPSPTTLTFYTIDGRQLQRNSNTTHASFTAPAAGVYIVKPANSSARKIMVF